MKKIFGKYGLPLEVKFCKKCTVNNQRPSSAIEFKQKKIHLAVVVDEYMLFIGNIVYIVIFSIIVCFIYGIRI